MFNCSGRKILLGIVTGTLLSTAVTTVVTASDRNTNHLIDSRGQPVVAQDGCVITPNTPNTPAKLFKKCGDIGDRDGDEILDDIDNCPDNTAEEISRGVQFSGPQKGCPIDTDGDFVANYRDNCPNNSPIEISEGVYDDSFSLGRTENSSPQNSNDQIGCPIDGDQDCVHDYRDDCRQTPYGENLCTEVLENGCLPEKDVVTIDETTGSALFEFDSAELTYHFKDVIDELLNEYKYQADRIEVVEVVGHTDPVGTQEYNQDLSERRAFSVVNYAIERGVPENLIFSQGVGEAEPAFRFDDEAKSDWHKRCRRVVATIRYSE